MRSRTSRRSKSSIFGGTTTMGAPQNMSARRQAKPEWCRPAMGWHPTKVQARPSAISKQRSQTLRFTPQASITIAPSAMRSLFSASQSIVIWG